MNDCMGIRSQSVFKALEREGALSATMARYYSPAIGRFISEDPLRFHGGINFYSYVENRPTMFRDPMGLVKWMCRYIFTTLNLPVGPGLAYADFECKSKCIGGKRVIANVYSVAGGASVGPLPAGQTFTSVELEYPFTTPFAGALSGTFRYVSGGFAGGGGASCTVITLGSAHGPVGVSECGVQYGLDLGGDVYQGRANVYYSREEKCCDKEQ